MAIKLLSFSSKVFKMSFCVFSSQQVLISALLDDKLVQLEDGPQIIRTINVLMVKIVENTDNTVSLG